MKCIYRISCAAAIVGGLLSPAHAETFTTLYRFTGAADGQQPSGSLAVQDGVIFGTTLGTYALGNFNCSPPGCGTAYAFNQSTGALNTLYDFTPGDKGYFPAGLVKSNNNLIGVTLFRGANKLGTIFNLGLTRNQVTVLAPIVTADAGAGVPIVHKGALYGTSSSATTGDENPINSEGSVYKFAGASSSLLTLHNFRGGLAGSKDGWYPLSTPTISGNILYGTTTLGGANQRGLIFQIDLTTGVLKELYSFTGLLDGKQPSGPITLSNGTLLGTAAFGGTVNKACPGGCGTAWKFDIAQGKFTLLHDFAGGDGAYPAASALLGGRLIVAAGYGGENGDGTIVSVDPALGGTTLVQVFAGSGNGATPTSLVKSGSELFGVTSSTASPDNKGTIFRITIGP